DEVLHAGRVRDELGHVAVGELLVDREAEVRELERDVRLQPFRLDSVEQLPVGDDDRARLGFVAHTFAEEGRIPEQPLVVQPPQDRDGRVAALAGDEAGGAEPESVLLDEALQTRAVRGREEQAAEGAQPAQAATIRSTSARSVSVSPRSGARTSGPTGTLRKPSTAFDAAWNGKRCSCPRSAVAFSE